MPSLTFDTPIGSMEAVANDTHLISLKFVDASKGKADSNTPILKKTQQQVQDYFSGKRTAFDIPLLFQGTDFQKQALASLSSIPYGQTISYKEQSQKLNRPKAYRAVGSANGANPFMVVIPCHRVIATNGRLGGYHGGLQRKHWLLNFEARK